MPESLGTPALAELHSGIELPEKTPFYGFLQKPSLVDFPGRITAVYFTSGCNFSCGYCHNARLLGTALSGITRESFTASVEKFMKTDWISGVTISGGEPTLSPKLPLFIRWIKSRGLAVKLDTNGSNPAMLEEILEDVDYIAMDIKCRLENYPGFVKFHDTEAIKRSVDLVRDRATDYEFRTTVLESVHNEEEMHAIGRLIGGARRYILQPFLPHEDLPDPAFRTAQRTSPVLIDRLAEIAQPYVVEVGKKGKG